MKDEPGAPKVVDRSIFQAELDALRHFPDFRQTPRQGRIRIAAAASARGLGAGAAAHPRVELLGYLLVVRHQLLAV